MNLRRHFPCTTSAKNPRSMYACVPQAMAQFVLKIEKLSHIMGPTPILEMALAYSLRPRLWLLVEIWRSTKTGIFLKGFNCSKGFLDKEIEQFYECLNGVPWTKAHISKLACHVHKHHHHMDFENVEVVGHEAHYHQRLFPEAWMSVKDPNAGNDHMVIPEVCKCLART